MRLKEFREARGISAAEVAARCGVSRQTIYAIEDGTFLPNTAIAIRLARILETSVEELFPLDEPEAPVELIRAELLTPSPRATAERCMVRLCRVGERILAVPVEAGSSFLPHADGVIERRTASRVMVRAVDGAPRGEESVVIAGCDPALSFLEEMGHGAGVRIVTVPCTSRKALEWLKEGRVHVAGSHLFDRVSGEYNLAIVQRMFPPGSTGTVTFASWQEGFITRTAEAEKIRGVADLGSGAWRIVNREKGSGSRSLLDVELKDAGITPAKVPGYDRIAAGHLAAALAVASGTADCCIATFSAARCFGLRFVPIAAERFDLVFSRPFAGSRSGQIVLNMLTRLALRRKLHELAGYDSSRTGDILL
ncbi:MAG: helix-turn-helix domain-containing protein [Acidobacteriaceae bacterium]|nr:helix-turn-helix domain-containing protein [Acidobacteriaceae bacterium]